MRSRILRYLSEGVKPVDIATIIGCSASYVSQLLSQDDFRAELSVELQKQGTKPEEELLTTKYTTMEHKLLNAMEQAMGDAKLGEITRALEVVAKRQVEVTRAKVPVIPPGTVKIVNLIMPGNMRFPSMENIPNVIMNTQKEVVQIGQDILAPMPSSSVKSMFEQLRERREQNELIANQTIAAKISAREELAIPEDM